MRWDIYDAFSLDILVNFIQFSGLQCYLTGQDMNLIKSFAFKMTGH